MKLSVLGSNGWYATDAANTACLLLEADDCYVVLDAGDGIYKLDKYIKSDKPIYVFLSHFHLDHIYGFHIFPKFRFAQEVTVFGQPGTSEVLQTVVNSPYTMPLEKLSFATAVRELPEGSSCPPDVPFPIEARYLVHPDPCFGYRLTIDDKVVAYCTDTGYCDNIVALARGADLLITECALAVGQMPNEKWPHLNPEIAAGAAREAGAKQLLLSHFSPGSYVNREDRQKAAAAARGILARVTAAYDGLEFSI